MDPKTLELLLNLVSLASQFAPIIYEQIQGIKDQSGKTVAQILDDMGVRLDANEVKGLALLAGIMQHEPVKPEDIK
jgi:hypothetical protein